MSYIRKKKTKMRWCWWDACFFSKNLSYLCYVDYCIVALPQFFPSRSAVIFQLPAYTQNAQNESLEEIVSILKSYNYKKCKKRKTISEQSTKHIKKPFKNNWLNHKNLNWGSWNTNSVILPVLGRNWYDISIIWFWPNIGYSFKIKIRLKTWVKIDFNSRFIVIFNTAVSRLTWLWFFFLKHHVNWNHIVRLRSWWELVNKIFSVSKKLT